MQIDFHHAATYVVARLAGFPHQEADIIAYASQYVDDATNGGYIKFDNGATYSRLATAHKMLDYRNFKELADHHSWLPFHFLPGNNLKRPGEKHTGRFVYRLVCKPGSYIAEDMVRDCILEKHRPYSLHRLGITMHVYIDTWAHYGFCGAVHEINRAKNIKLYQNDNHIEDCELKSRLKDFFKDIFDDIAGDFVSDIQPLGHGSVLSYPDQPYLRWHYVNGLGDKIDRDNPSDYLKAVEGMYAALCRFRLGDPDASITPMSSKDFNTIKSMIYDITHMDGDKRHTDWMQAIRDGSFSFGGAEIAYIPKGAGSWKHKALGTTKAKDDCNDVFEYTEDFLTSDWKMFHDAAKAHSFNMLHNVLPRYGICVG